MISNYCFHCIHIIYTFQEIYSKNNNIRWSYLWDANIIYMLFLHFLLIFLFIFICRRCWIYCLETGFSNKNPIFFRYLFISIRSNKEIFININKLFLFHFNLFTVSNGPFDVRSLFHSFVGGWQVCNYEISIGETYTKVCVGDPFFHRAWIVHNW